jgi:exonuclease SbcC
MKPVRLTLSGLNSFVEPQTIDFEALSSRGLFGIFGPTGSGKSTIIDGMIISLYGAGSIPRGTKDFINMDTDQASMTFVFRTSVQGVMREIEIFRAFKRSNEGYRSHQNRLIFRTIEGEILWIEDKLSEISRRIEEIIGLKSDEFLKMVVLPQGQFSAFLQMDPSNRRNMLQSLFGLERYGDRLSERLKGHVNALGVQISAEKGRLAAFEAVNEEKLKEQQRLVEELQANTEGLAVESRQYKLAHDALSQRFEREKKYAALKAELAAHESERALYTLELSRFESHQRALPGRSTNQELKVQQQLFLNSVGTRETCRMTFETAEKALAAHRVTFETLEKENARLPMLKLEAQSLRMKCEDARKLEGGRIELKRIEQTLAFKADQNTQAQLTLEKAQSALAQASERLESLEALQAEQWLTSEALLEASAAETHWKTICEDQVKLAGIQQRIEAASDDVKAFELSKEHAGWVQESLQQKKLQLEKSIAENENERELLRDQAEALREISGSQRLHLTEISQVFEAWNNEKKALEALEREIATLSEHLLECEADYEAGLAARLRSRLMAGEPCPVCGNVCLDPLLFHASNQEVDFDWMERLETDQKNLAVLKHRKMIEQQANEARYAILKAAGVLTLAELDALRDVAVRTITEEASLGNEKLNLETVLEAMKQELSQCLLSKAEADKTFEEQRQVVEKKKSDLAVLNAQRIGIQEAITENNRAFETYAESHMTLSMNFSVDQVNIEQHFESLHHFRKLTEARSVELKSLRSQCDGYRQDQHHAMTVLSNLQIEIERESGEYRQRHAEIQRLQAQIGQTYTLLTLEKSMADLETHIKNVECDYPVEFSQLQLHTQALESARRAHDLAAAAAEANQNMVNLTEISFRAKWKEAGFKDEAAWEAALMTEEEAGQLEQRLADFRDTSRSLLERISEYADLSDHPGLNQEVILISAQKAAEAETAWAAAIESCGKAAEVLRKGRFDLEQKNESSSRLKSIEKDLSYYESIQRLLRGNRFVEFLAMHQLEYILQEASRRLLAMTANRYRLEVDSRGNFRISDNHQGGVSRDLKTLSGGETFMASLALALALSSRLQLRGNVRLETFLLDEGFGSLDAGLIDVVMQSLESLIGEQLSVGLISHVESLKARVPVRLEVTPAESGVSGTLVKLIVN